MIGTPLSPSSTKVMLLGSGELGKEVAIELQRMGCEVVACDRYDNAPAMQVAHSKRIFAMTDAEALRQAINEEKPDLIVPEVEAIATEVLIEVETKGQKVVPTARATQLTMNREGIRRLVAEELSLPTSPYRFVTSGEQAKIACDALDYPCVIKPVMSSSGHGQSVIKSPDSVQECWNKAQKEARGGADTCIIEGFVEFQYEITLLTVSAVNGLFCCPPIGHRQENGDYRESWQPQPMPAELLSKAEHMAKKVVKTLGGYGLFGVELFICGDEVLFSEVSPRPHDTGLVTLGSQNLSEFALHARALLGLPVPTIELLRPGASVPLLGHGEGVPYFEGLEKALAVPESQVRLFGKPVCSGHRRLAVTIATGENIEQARQRAQQMANDINVGLLSS